jgi:hypothetical protein
MAWVSCGEVSSAHRTQAKLEPEEQPHSGRQGTKRIFQRVAHRLVAKALCVLTHGPRVSTQDPMHRLALNWRIEEQTSATSTHRGSEIEGEICSVRRIRHRHLQRQGAVFAGGQNTPGGVRMK